MAREWPVVRVALTDLGAWAKLAKERTRDQGEFMVMMDRMAASVVVASARGYGPDAIVDQPGLVGSLRAETLEVYKTYRPDVTFVDEFADITLVARSGDDDAWFVRVDAPSGDLAIVAGEHRARG